MYLAFLLCLLINIQLVTSTYKVCEYYFATDTNNAQSNYYSCKFYACPYETINIAGCYSQNGAIVSATGDQYLRLFDESNNQVAYDDDGNWNTQGCGRSSYISYTMPSYAKCQTYTIHQGCYGSNTCAGQVVVFDLASNLLTLSYCSPGTYLSVSGDSCISCPSNTYSTGYDDVCRNCPVGSWSLPGSTTCTCNKGYSQSGFGDSLSCSSCGSSYIYTSQSCPSSYTMMNPYSYFPKCYRYVDQYLSYGDAVAFCNNNNGWLVTISNRAENGIVNSLHPNKNSWIGLNDISHEGSYKWINPYSGGMPSYPIQSKYLNWNNAEPNDAYNGEDCGHQLSTGTWNDNRCDDPATVFVCESNIIDTCQDTSNNANKVPIKILCDNYCKVYVNGLYVGYSSSWNQLTLLTPTINSMDVIAVEAIDAVENGENFAAFAVTVSYPNGEVFSSNSWKCTTVPTTELPSNWNINSFDDSSWPFASTYGSTSSNTIWGVNNMQNSAQFIWTSDNFNHNHIICRYKPPQPTSLPTFVPSKLPSLKPTLLPSIQPSMQPTLLPSIQPSMQPTLVPSIQPTSVPSIKPTSVPSTVPTFAPTKPGSTMAPTVSPTFVPSSIAPSPLPSMQPSMQPTLVPSIQPTSVPSIKPTSVPSTVPTFAPTKPGSTMAPTVSPTFVPSSIAPSPLPTALSFPTVSVAIGSSAEWLTVHQTRGVQMAASMESAMDSIFARSGIFYRTCSDCLITHRNIYYKRVTPLKPNYSMYKNVIQTWSSNNNVLNIDFYLYSSWDDLQSDTNRWQACNYDDTNVGFPRDCGPSSLVTFQWVSNSSLESRTTIFAVYQPPKIVLTDATIVNSAAAADNKMFLILITTTIILFTLALLFCCYRKMFRHPKSDSQEGFVLAEPSAPSDIELGFSSELKVQQELQQSTKVEQELQQLAYQIKQMKVVLSEHKEQRQDKKSEKEPELAVTKTLCKICLDMFETDGGYSCSNQHFTCWECLEACIHACGSPDAVGKTIDSEGNVKCVEPGCDQCITTLKLSKVSGCPESVFKSLEELKVTSIAAIKVATALAEQEARLQAEFKRIQAIQDKQERDIEMLKLDICNSILNLHCPRCRMVFVDFDGCFALTCSNKTCNAAFCAWCLQDCGDDAHRHVAHCKMNTNPGDPYGTLEEFQNHHKKEKRRLVIEKLQDQSLVTRDAVLLKINEELKALQIPVISSIDF